MALVCIHTWVYVREHVPEGSCGGHIRLPEHRRTSLSSSITLHLIPWITLRLQELERPCPAWMWILKDLNPGPHDCTASTFIHWATFSGPPKENINSVKDNRTANRLFKNWLFEEKKYLPLWREKLELWYEKQSKRVQSSQSENLLLTNKKSQSSMWWGRGVKRRDHIKNKTDLCYKISVGVRVIEFKIQNEESEGTQVGRISTG